MESASVYIASSGVGSAEPAYIERRHRSGVETRGVTLGHARPALLLLLAPPVASHARWLVHVKSLNHEQ